MTRQPRRVVVAVAFAAVVLVSAAVGATCGPSTDDGPATHGPYRVVTQDYLPGLAADVHLPTGVVTAPVVVLVPGGAWLTADRAGLTPLAQFLAGAGIVAVNTTHRAARSGGRFPGPIGEVICAVDFAVQRAREAGIGASTVVVLGHSSGAHLAALAALATDRFRSSCPYQRAGIDALAGLAGPYDVNMLPDVAEPLFGATPAEDPEAWREGNPMWWVGRGAQRSRPRVFLAHGSADSDVPTWFTTGFADALRGAGYEVTVRMVAKATHHTLYSAAVIGPPLVSWLRTLSPTPAASTTPQ